MPQLCRAVGVAALLLGSAPLFGCYAPPPPVQVAAVAPVPAAYPAAGEVPMVAPYAPPAAQVETPPPPPAPLAVWERGHWAWTGAQYSWVAGHYDVRPSPAANWVPGYWREGPAGWTWVAGYWS